ncbi:MAG: diguanylate cyclase (GGDEF)-like protein [Gammaproteobacteria bacterium]|jgi:diguanylate cyclase (GGDEF)-like protein
MSELPNKPVILLVASSSQNARLINRLLEKIFEIVTVDDAESGWSSLLEQSNISLVISELVLVNNAFGLLERVREANSTRLAATPVLLLVGEQDSDKLRDQAIDLGATDFINSPFSSAELLTRSRLHVDLHVQQTQDNANEIQHSGATNLLHQLSQEKFFHSRVQQELSFSQRHSSNFSLSKLKVDNMKAVVASFDKVTAVAVIRAVANIIQKTLRFEDSLCYSGNAEFYLWYPATNGIGATSGINRILQQIALRKIKVAGKLIPITLSGAV